MIGTALHQPSAAGSSAAVLASARSAKRAENAAAVQLLSDAVAWALMHEPVESADAAYWWEGGAMIPLAGEGTPLVAEYAVAELAAAIGLTTDAGRRLIGQAIELAHRLPRTWEQTRAGRVPAWRVRRVAEATMALTPEAASFVDVHVAAVAGSVSVPQLDRLVTEARRRWMGDLTGTDEYSLPDTRRVNLFPDEVSFDGTVHLDAELDLADALDLDRALQETAAQLGLAGSSEGLHARRAAALGELARTQLALQLGAPVDGDRPVGRRSGTHGRPVQLFVHLTQDAVTGTGGEVGRCENTRTPIDPDTIRAWCGTPDAQVTVTPVLDLAAHVRVDAYEVPGRLTRQVDQRDGGCVFPWCTRPARACDHDHAIPHAQGGPTCSCNIVALCRHHHRLKTHTPWRYRVPEPGVYLWTSPHGYLFLRDHRGTTDVTPAGLAAVPGCRGEVGPVDPGPPG